MLQQHTSNGYSDTVRQSGVGIVRRTRSVSQLLNSSICTRSMAMHNGHTQITQFNMIRRRVRVLVVCLIPLEARGGKSSSAVYRKAAGSALLTPPIPVDSDRYRRYPLKLTGQNVPAPPLHLKSVHNFSSSSAVLATLAATKGQDSGYFKTHRGFLDQLSDCFVF